MRSFFDDQGGWVNVSGNDSLNVYEDGVLRISAHSEEKEEEKKKNRVVHRMQRTASFNYATYLPRPIEADKIAADVENGVVTVTAPIAEAVKSTKDSSKSKGTISSLKTLPFGEGFL